MFLLSSLELYYLGLYELLLKAWVFVHQFCLFSSLYVDCETFTEPKVLYITSKSHLKLSTYFSPNFKIPPGSLIFTCNKVHENIIYQVYKEAKRFYKDRTKLNRVVDLTLKIKTPFFLTPLVLWLQVWQCWFVCLRTFRFFLSQAYGYCCQFPTLQWRSQATSITQIPTPSHSKKFLTAHLNRIPVTMLPKQDSLVLRCYHYFGKRSLSLLGCL